MERLTTIGSLDQAARASASAGRLRISLVLLAMAALVIQALCFYEEVSRRTLQDTAGIQFNLDLVITSVADVAQPIGIESGDRIVGLDGEPVSRILDYRRILDRSEAGSMVTLTVARDGETLDLLPVQVETRPLDLSVSLRHVAGLGFLLVGALVALVGPEKRAARLFVLASVLLGLYVALMQSPVSGLVYLRTAALILAPAVIIHFFLSFPEERTLARSRWVWLLYVPSLVLMVVAFWAYHDAVQAGTGVYQAPLHALLTDQVAFSYLQLSGILGLTVMGHVYATTPEPLKRRQLQWIMLGLSCAIVTAAVDLVLTVSAEQNVLVFRWLLLGFLPIPVAFALAILRYRLWDLDLVLSRSVVYGLVTATLAAFYLLLVSGLSTALGIAAGSRQYSVLLFVSALLIGLLVQPARGRFQALVDRVFFRQQIDYRVALAQWSEELSTSLRFADLARLLLQEIPERLQIDHGWLLVLDESECCLETLSFPDHDPGPMGDVSIHVHSGWAIQLSRPGTVLLLHDEAGVLAQLGNDSRALLTEWREAGAELALPLVSGGKLVGIYLLGHKRSGDVYQRQEIEFLRTLSNQAAVAIANARLYEQVSGLSEELERKVQDRTKELRDFVSAVYHELSTPITSIRGYNELLLDSPGGMVNTRQMHHLAAIKRSVVRLMRLVADLSDVSKIEDGRLTIHPEALDLRQVLSETLGSLMGLIDEKGLQLTVSIPPDVSKVCGDRHRVVQILTNLLSNACRYTAAGGQIRVTARRVNDDYGAGGRGPGLVELTVADTGIGIHREDLEHIFERFYRSDDPIVQEQPGTGLGLAITKSLVELHGSRLWVNSTVGEGSTFGFSLPLVEANQIDDRKSAQD